MLSAPVQPDAVPDTSALELAHGATGTAEPAQDVIAKLIKGIPRNKRANENASFGHTSPSKRLGVATTLWVRRVLRPLVRIQDNGNN